MHSYFTRNQPFVGPHVSGLLVCSPFADYYFMQMRNESESVVRSEFVPYPLPTATDAPMRRGETRQVNMFSIDSIVEGVRR